jgi:hypothetical protein
MTLGKSVFTPGSGSWTGSAAGTCMKKHEGQRGNTEGFSYFDSNCSVNLPVSAAN